MVASECGRASGKPILFAISYHPDNKIMQGLTFTVHKSSSPHHPKTDEREELCMRISNSMKHNIPQHM